MTGLLSSKGLKISQQRVGEALQVVNPENHHERQSGMAQHLTSIPYHADYFGHKVHIDQNEKLSMYGVTHISAIDGYSSSQCPLKTTYRFMSIYTGMSCTIICL